MRRKRRVEPSMSVNRKVSVRARAPGIATSGQRRDDAELACEGISGVEQLSCRASGPSVAIGHRRDRARDSRRCERGACPRGPAVEWVAGPVVTLHATRPYEERALGVDTLRPRVDPPSCRAELPWLTERIER